MMLSTYKIALPGVLKRLRRERVAEIAQVVQQAVDAVAPNTQAAVSVSTSLIGRPAIQLTWGAGESAAWLTPDEWHKAISALEDVFEHELAERIADQVHV